MDGQNQKLYTIQDLENEGIGDRITQYRWRKESRISFYKIGTRIFYAPHHLAAFLARNERTAKAEKQKQAA